MLQAVGDLSKVRGVVGMAVPLGLFRGKRYKKMSSKPNASTAAVSTAILARQPILDRDERLSGFELLYRSPDGKPIVDDHQATEQVVLNTINEFGLTKVLGTHRGFVNVGGATFETGLLEILSPRKFVLEILETVKVDASLQKHCARLKGQGYTIAFDDINTSAKLTPLLLSMANIVKIDLPLTCPNELPLIVEKIHAGGARALAEKVETREEYALVKRLGFDLFQGYFFARPELLSQKKIPASRGPLLLLLNTLAGNASVAELEASIKANPPVLIQLMKLAHSSGLAGSRAPASIREAIMRVGVRRLSRWTHLLLYASDNAVSLQDNALVQLVATRANFMELAVTELYPDNESMADSAFQTGMFSLMHVVTQQTSEALIEQLPVRPEVRDAILHHTGELGYLLQLAEVLEGTTHVDGGSTRRLSGTPALRHETAMRLYSEAAIIAEGYGR